MQRFNHSPKSFVLGLLLCPLVLSFAGCGGGGSTKTKVDPDKDKYMSALGVLYGECMRGLKGRAPKDEAEFRSFLESSDEVAPILSTFKVASVDDLWKAPRGEAKTVVVYGNQIAQAGRGYWVAYEAEATGGKRFVVTDGGRISELGEEQFRQYFPSAP